MRLITALLAIITTFALVACNEPSKAASEQPTPPLVSEQQATNPDPQLPQTITLDTTGLEPEGIEYDARYQRFLVGSVSTGTIYAVDNTGTLTAFIEDSDISASIGIEVDEERNRLLVVNSDISAYRGGATGFAKLGVYNLSTGQRIAMVDLGAADPIAAKARLANDVTVNSDGIIFVTDSLARVVYKVDLDYQPSVLLGNQFGDQKEFMLNGLVAHPAGYLLVAESMAGMLYKIPLQAPNNFSAVTLAEPALGADGITWHPNGNLLVTSNGTQRILAFSSNDHWLTAELVAAGNVKGMATTVTTAGTAVYVIDPMFDDPKVKPVISRIEMK